MDKAVIVDHVPGPELLVTCSGKNDLLARRNLDERAVFHLGPDGDDVLGVIRDLASASVFLREHGNTGCESEDEGDEDALHGTLLGYRVEVEVTANERGRNGRSLAS